MGAALLTEDDADMREILRAFFEARGWRVTAVPNGAEALASARAERFDVAVVDIRSPASAGIALLRALRAGRDMVPIIVTTSFPDAALASQVAALGASAVVDKPFDLETVGRALDHVLQRSPKRLSIR